MGSISHRLEEVPRQYFTYCNLNYGLLGTVIEAVTGQRFDDYQKAHILKDLDCRGDYVPGNLPQAEFEKLGTIYGKDDEGGSWQGQIDDFEGRQPEKRRLPFKILMQKRSVRPMSWMGTGPGPMPPFFASRRTAPVFGRNGADSRDDPFMTGRIEGGESLVLLPYGRCFGLSGSMMATTAIPAAGRFFLMA